MTDRIGDFENDHEAMEHYLDCIDYFTNELRGLTNTVNTEHQRKVCIKEIAANLELLANLPINH